MVSFVDPSSARSAKMSDFFCEELRHNGRLLGSLGHPWGTLGLHWGALCAKNMSNYGLKSRFSRFGEMCVFLCVLLCFSSFEPPSGAPNACLGAFLGSWWALLGTCGRHHGSKCHFGAPLGGPRCPQVTTWSGGGWSMEKVGGRCWPGGGGGGFASELCKVFYTIV